MAKYKTHTFFNFFILPFIIFLLIRFYKPTMTEIGMFSAFYIYSTLFMNPDLDLVNEIKLFSIRGILTLPFRGYSLLFRHRGLSHSFILGSITRILWLGSIFFIILFFLDKSYKLEDIILILKSNLFKIGFLAIILADLAHLMLDFNHKKYWFS